MPANEENENRLDVEASTDKVRKLVTPSSQNESPPDDTHKPGQIPDIIRNPGKGNKKRDSLQTEKSDQPKEESSEPTQRRKLVVPPKVEAGSDDTRNPGKGNKKRGAGATEAIDDSSSES